MAAVSRTVTREVLTRTWTCDSNKGSDGFNKVTVRIAIPDGMKYISHSVEIVDEEGDVEVSPGVLDREGKYPEVVATIKARRRVLWRKSEATAVINVVVERLS